MTSKRFNDVKLRQLLRRYRAMVGKLSENPDRLNDLNETDFAEMICLKQRANEALEEDEDENEA